MKLISTVLLQVLMTSVTSYYFSLYRHPDVTADNNNFDAKQFVGTWYLHKSTGDLFYCTTYTFEKTFKGYKVSVSMEPFTNRQNILNETYLIRDSANITVGSVYTPAMMTIKWRNRPMGNMGIADSEFIVTSLNAIGGYASIVESQYIPFGGIRTNVIVLSRSNSSLPVEAIKEIEDALDRRAISKLLTTDQISCLALDQVDIVIDLNNPVNRSSSEWKRLENLLGPNY